LGKQIIGFTPIALARNAGTNLNTAITVYKMTKINIEGVVDMLLALCARRYSEKERLLIITAWEHELKDISPEDLLKGRDKAISEHDGFLTPPGDFKELCLSSGGCVSFEDEGAEAWALVMKNLNSTIAPVFKDTAIAETINKMGGWAPFCLSITGANEAFKRADFIGLYVVCRNSKEEFSPMPDRVGKIFMGGEYKKLGRFIGNFSPEEKSAAVKMIQQREQVVKRLGF